MQLRCDVLPTSTVLVLDCTEVNIGHHILKCTITYCIVCLLCKLKKKHFQQTQQTNLE